MDGLRVAEVPQSRAFKIDGELDLSSASSLTAALKRDGTGGPVFVDIQELTFLDASGVRAWLGVAAALRARGWCLILHDPIGSVRTVLELCGVDRVDNVHIVNDDGPDRRVSEAPDAT